MSTKPVSTSVIKDPATAKRSPHWPTVEHKYLKEHPTCAACGTTLKVQVHHKKPFHLHPELELDPNNLISLCMDGDKDCHLRVGHGDSFKAYNPNVVEDAAYVLAHQSTLTEALNTISAKAKAQRLFE
jgi:hypothetical protein